MQLPVMDALPSRTYAERCNMTSAAGSPHLALPPHRARQREGRSTAELRHVITPVFESPEQSAAQHRAEGALQDSNACGESTQRLCKRGVWLGTAGPGSALCRGIARPAHLHRPACRLRSLRRLGWCSRHAPCCGWHLYLHNSVLGFGIVR